MKSIIVNLEEKRCACCGTTKGLELHHVVESRQGFKKKAEEDGLLVWLCFKHHRDNNDGVHGCNKKLDRELKENAEAKWILTYNKTIEEWVQRYNKNYLDV